MEYKEYQAIGDAMEKAEEDVTPFVIMKNEAINVVGDANKTEIHKHDYKITFRVVKDGKYEWSDQEFKDVYITPRNDMKVTRLFAELQPYFKKKNGERFTKEEAMHIITDESLLDIMYDTVAAVLHIPDKLKEFMEPGSVLKAVTQIIRDFPETQNEADFFTE